MLLNLNVIKCMTFTCFGGSWPCIFDDLYHIPDDFTMFGYLAHSTIHIYDDICQVWLILILLCLFEYLYDILDDHRHTQI